MSRSAALERMKSRNLFLVLLLIVVSTVSLWFLTSYPAESFRSIVSKTQSGLKNLPTNVKTDKERTVNPLYLKRLGLISSKSGEAKDGAVQTNSLNMMTHPSSLPVIATVAKPDVLGQATALLRSTQKLLPDYRVVVFDMGLSTSDKTKLHKACNTTANCEIQTFVFDNYPSHVAYLDINSYTPVCIQEALNAHGSVIWVDGGHYFIEKNLTAAIGQAQKSGIVAWPMKDPTSSLTHLKMFQYFNTDPHSYYFQHAVWSSHLIVYKTNTVMKDIMLPWVKCALLEECINPPGAQNTGCVDFRKPLFKYRGCHKYDQSALNIILGKAFNFDESVYTSRLRLFGSLADDALRAQNRSRPVHEISLGVGHKQIKI